MSNLRYGTCYQHTRQGEHVIPCPPEAHGYPNRETWRVNMELWSSDEPAYRALMESRHDDLYDLAEWLKEETSLRVLNDPYLAQNWADAMLSMVDWNHLAEAWHASNPELIRPREDEPDDDNPLESGGRRWAAGIRDFYGIDKPADPPQRYTVGGDGGDDSYAVWDETTGHPVKVGLSWEDAHLLANLLNPDRPITPEPSADLDYLRLAADRDDDEPADA